MAEQHLKQKLAKWQVHETTLDFLSAKAHNPNFPIGLTREVLLKWEGSAQLSVDLLILSCVATCEMENIIYLFTKQPILIRRSTYY